MDQRQKKRKIEIEERTGKSAFPNAVTGTNDQYPFEELGMGQLLDGRIRGGVSGPCFFIPGTDKPDQRLQLARKQHPDVLFVSRRATKQIDGKPVHGSYVWKVPLLPTKPYQRMKPSRAAAPPPPRAEFDPTEWSRQKDVIEFASSKQHQQQPPPPPPDNETTQLVLRYLLQHERVPRKWIGRASVLRKFRP